MGEYGIPDAAQAYNFGQPGDQRIIDLLRGLLVRTGRIDPAWDLTGYPKVFWDDAIDTSGNAVLSAVGYPYITTFFPRQNDSIAAIPTQGSWLIIGTLGNSGATAPNQIGSPNQTYAATSETILLVSLAANKTLATQNGLSYQQGTRIRVFSRGSGAVMEGNVTGYNGGPVLTFDPDYAIGVGSFSDWNLSVAGVRGQAGIDGQSITGVALSGGHLIITFSDLSTHDVGQVVGANGADGVSITGANISGGHLHITLSTGADIDVGQVVGAAGTNGTKVVFGNPNPNTTAPSGGPFQVGDVYMRTNGAQHVFTYNGATWNDTGFTP